MEEHSVIGGLGGALAELLSTEMPVSLQRMGVPDAFGTSGTSEELLEHFGLTPVISPRWRWTKLEDQGVDKP